MSVAVLASQDDKRSDTPAFRVELASLCCPYGDHGGLKRDSSKSIVCEACGRSYFEVDGRPILFDESRSIFNSSEVAVLSDKRQFPEDKGWRYRVRRMFPAAASRGVGPEMLARLTAELPNNPSVLVIGCGTSNELYTELFSSGRVFLTDVTLQGDAEVVCDGGCLPFRDQSLDCVIADQVLEHVLYPAAVVAEIYRCLRPEGLVYSGVPFHTPVHGFPYDFQRYTPLGHRMLFNRFQELELLITQGPVSAFSLSLIGLLACISSSIWWRRFSSFGVRLIVKPLLWIDKRQRTVRNLTIPAASAFLGRKQVGEVTPNEVIRNWIDEGAKGLIENRELGPLSTLSSTR